MTIKTIGILFLGIRPWPYISIINICECHKLFHCLCLNPTMNTVSYPPWEESLQKLFHDVDLPSYLEKFGTFLKETFKLVVDIFTSFFCISWNLERCIACIHGYRLSCHMLTRVKLTFCFSKSPIRTTRARKELMNF